MKSKKKFPKDGEPEVGMTCMASPITLYCEEKNGDRTMQRPAVAGRIVHVGKRQRYVVAEFQVGGCKFRESFFREDLLGWWRKEGNHVHP